MSEENAINFMIALGNDKELKSAYLGIMVQYADKSLSKDKWSKIVQEKVIPLAKERGYDFNTEEFEALQKQTEKLSDEELDHVTGGSTQFTHIEEKNGSVFRVTSHCEMLDMKEKFIQRYLSDDCFHYEWNGSGSNDRKCASCASFCFAWEVEYLGPKNY